MITTPKPPPPVAIDQLHLPRRERQFPFRAANESEQAEVNRDISAAIAGVDNMLYQLARRRLCRDVRSDVLDDAVQAVRLHLWTYSLPRYDQWRGVKLTTFIYTCVGRAISGYARGLSRARKNEQIHEDFVAPDRFHDRSVEALADAIVAHPEQYLAPRFAVRFDLLRSQNVTPAEAQKHGIAFRTYNCQRHLARKRCSEIAAANF